jgi:hypothetical protein
MTYTGNACSFTISNDVDPCAVRKQRLDALLFLADQSVVVEPTIPDTAPPGTDGDGDGDGDGDSGGNDGGDIGVDSDGSSGGGESGSVDADDDKNKTDVNASSGTFPVGTVIAGAALLIVVILAITLLVRARLRQMKPLHARGRSGQFSVGGAIAHM